MPSCRFIGANASTADVRCLTRAPCYLTPAPNGLGLVCGPPCRKRAVHKLNGSITGSVHDGCSFATMRASVLAAVLAAGACACGSATGAPHIGVKPPGFVVATVRGSLSRLRDPRPVSARFVLTRRQAANEILSSAGVNSNQPVYAVIVKGWFRVSRPGPHATGFLHVPVVFYVIDARTGRETDDGFGRALPDLSKLGTTHDLLRYIRGR